MFKFLILQRYYGLRDKQIEYQIIDRISFKNFLGLETGDKTPDKKSALITPQKFFYKQLKTRDEKFHL